jgi:peptidoglycan/LPS O-acetylase OafA/YrhL
VFFIVSGFSLSIAYTKTRNREIILKIACGRHLRLALPILAFSLLMYACINLGLVPPVDQRPVGFQRFITHSPVFFDTVAFSFFGVFFDYQRSITLIPPLWTMPIELTGSFLVFGLCLFFGWGKYRLFFYLVAAIILYFYNLYCTAFISGLIFGEIYVMREKFPNFWLPFLSFFIGSILAIYLPAASQAMYLTVAIVMFYGMAFCLPIRIFFENRISKFLGRISFTLYLLHGPIIWVYALNIIGAMNRNGIIDNVPILLAINVTTAIIAVALSKKLVWIDEWSVRISRKFSQAIMAVLTRAKALNRMGSAPPVG